MRAAADHAVVIHGADVHVSQYRDDVAVAEVRHRYGGLDGSAVLLGALAGIGAAAALMTLAAAALTIVYRQGWLGQDALTAAGLVTGLAVALLAAFAAGWTAGRAGRYDGGRNGLLAGIGFVAAAAALVAAGASQGQLFRTTILPRWVRDDATDTRALSLAIVAAVAACLVSLAAGSWAGRWHRHADDLLLGTRDGGVSPYPEHTS